MCDYEGVFFFASSYSKIVVVVFLFSSLVLIKIVDTHTEFILQYIHNTDRVYFTRKCGSGIIKSRSDTMNEYCTTDSSDQDHLAGSEKFNFYFFR